MTTLHIVLIQGFAFVGELKERLEERTDPDGPTWRIRHRWLERPLRVETVHVAVQGPRGAQVVSQTQIQLPFGWTSIESIQVGDGAVIIPVETLSRTERRDIWKGIEACEELRKKSTAKEAGLVLP